MIRIHVGISLLLVVVFASQGEAMRARPSASQASVKVERIDEFFESLVLPRIQFSGPFVFQADPPRGFTFVREPSDGAAFQLRHYLFPEVIIQAFFYENSGSTAYKDETWNRLLTTWGKRMGKPFAFGIEEPLDVTRNNGPVIFEHISSTATLYILNQENGDEFRQRFLVVPVTGTNKVYMMTFWAPAEQYRALLPLFESFAGRFYRM